MDVTIIIEVTNEDRRAIGALMGRGIATEEDVREWAEQNLAASLKAAYEVD